MRIATANEIGFQPNWYLVDRLRKSGETLADRPSCRILSAPTGWGKTIALRSHVGRFESPGAYTSVTFGDTFETIKDRIERVDPAFEIAIDDADLFERDEAAKCSDYIALERKNRRFLIAGRTRERLPGAELIASGDAILIDPRDLAFSVREATELADAYACRRRHEDIDQIVSETDGWPLAIEWILRFAAYDGFPLYEAYPLWRRRHARHLVSYVASRCRRDGDAFVEFMRLASSPSSDPCQEDWNRFEALGFPIVRSRDSVRPLRFFVDLQPTDDSRQTSRIPTLRFKLFGRFRCSIDGRELAFKRRRDRHVFSFVALAPDGFISREALLKAFWPDSDHTVAAQNLRTTLSRIRQSIADIVESKNVDRYFRTDRDICIDLKNATIDTRRFDEHVRWARSEEARGEHATARHHYAAAERLYEDRLLSSEPVETCFSPLVEAAHASYLAVRSWLEDKKEDDATDVAPAPRHRSSALAFT